MKLKRKCLVCTKQFNTYPSADKKFCSPECRFKYFNNHCCCGNALTKGKYCSKECREKKYRQARINRKNRIDEVFDKCKGFKEFRDIMKKDKIDVLSEYTSRIFIKKVINTHQDIS